MNHHASLHNRKLADCCVLQLGVIQVGVFKPLNTEMHLIRVSACTRPQSAH